MKHAMKLTLVLALVGCGKKEQEKPAEPVPSQGKGTPPPPAAPPPATPYSTPESMAYDEANDRYIITNINGGPNDKDDNGFILVQAADGKTTRWIDGASADIKLDGPKGFALVDGTLWVADIDTVRRFDKDGKQLPDIPIPGSTFLNDVVADGAGGIYISDSGLDAKLQPTETDAIYRVDKDGKVSPVIKDKGLGKPNGLWLGEDGKLIVVTFGTGEMFTVDAAGTKSASEKLPKGSLDGIVAIPGGEFLVSSWEAKAIFRGKSGNWKTAFTDLESPADIGYDAKKKLVLVPLFTPNEVKLLPLP